jgi:prepilin-type N-terminal cleavage/methylation domain-containing protein/prepilin-type processing-associated H-X9-DG protein
MNALTRHARGRPRAFTLVELLVTIAIIAVLTGLALGALSRTRGLAQGAHCANSLRQLGAATAMYLADHDQRFFAYSAAVTGGRLWYFGLESSASLAAKEGDRDLDVTQAPLYPYVRQVGGVEVCPAFPYHQALWKPKYKGASWGYGYNTLLSDVNVNTLASLSQIIVFGDCAQVNTFQAPATPKKPMLEEFYILSSTDKTIHFRHGALANMLFADGHVEGLKLYPGTQDTRLRNVRIGRITPVGSTEYLR